MANSWDYLLHLLKGNGDASSGAPAPSLTSAKRSAQRPAGSTQFQFGWPGFIKHPFDAIKDAEQEGAAGAPPE
jgi:hypothetical protein